MEGRVNKLEGRAVEFIQLEEQEEKRMKKSEVPYKGLIGQDQADQCMHCGGHRR